VAHWDTIKWLLGPSGLGALYVWNSNRIRARVRNFAAASVDARFISFEAENISGTKTSMEPVFTLVGYTPKRERETYAFTIENKDRALEPHKVTLFTAAHSAPQNRLIFFLWYMTFTMPLTRGRTVKLRFRNGEFKPIGLLPFYSGLLCFRWFGWVPEQPPHTRNTQLAMQAEFRAQETLTVGTPDHPDLKERAHRGCVVQCKLVNESREKVAIVHGVQAFDRRGDALPIDWSDGIDDLGMPDHCGSKIRVEGENMLYIRHRQGMDVNYARIVIEHNMPHSPAFATLDDYFIEGGPA
jgi:hypothetical protein